MKELNELIARLESIRDEYSGDCEISVFGDMDGYLKYQIKDPAIGGWEAPPSYYI